MNARHGFSIASSGKGLSLREIVDGMNWVVRPGLLDVAIVIRESHLPLMR